MFVKKIVVQENKFDWKLNYLDEVLDDELFFDNEELENIDKDIFLTRIVITKDDVDKFLEHHKEYKYLRLKEHIIVDVYL